MHPVFAAKSCDPEGKYVKRWCPELARLPIEYIHCPWEAPVSLLAAAGVRLGGNYPRPIISDLETCRVKSFDAVMEVRRRVEGRNHRGGHESMQLDGQEIYLI